MKRKFFSAFLAVVFLAGFVFAQEKKETAMKDPGVYSFTMKTIDGQEKPLADYKGDVLMIVNVASFCGHTPQYQNLEELYKKYKDEGFKILAFPANNFGGQEPGTNKEIKDFCDTKYHVTFDMFSKISVKGDDQHPLYHYLTSDTNFKGDIGWNFTKFLVDRNGKVVARFATKVLPTDDEVIQKIKELLTEKSS
ncbi:MAG TPA: glutathione peroxidase [Bacteroidota bacterium]|nr:glutathione peroxidase [Bacteroidota bacterium]